MQALRRLAMENTVRDYRRGRTGPPIGSLGRKGPLLRPQGWSGPLPRSRHDLPRGQPCPRHQRAWTHVGGHRRDRDGGGGGGGAEPDVFFIFL